jgi:hypothetical protein
MVELFEPIETRLKYELILNEQTIKIILMNKNRTLQDIR